MSHIISNVLLKLSLIILFNIVCAYTVHAAPSFLDSKIELLGLNNTTPLAFPFTDNENLILHLPPHWDIRLIGMSKGTMHINTRPARNTGAFILNIGVHKATSEEPDIKSMLKESTVRHKQHESTPKIIQFSEHGYYVLVEVNSPPHSRLALMGILRSGNAYLVFRFEAVDHITETSKAKLLELISKSHVVKYKENKTVHRCDHLASDWEDKQAITPGVSEQIFREDSAIRKNAIRECTDAITRYPGNARYHYQLGRIYSLTKLTKHHEKMMEHWTSAASLGHAQAHYQLGFRLLRARGKPRSDIYQSASEWFQKGANLEHADSIYKLTTLQYKQKNPRYSIENVIKTLSVLGKNGHIRAQYYLGMLYSKGLVADGSPEDAIHWLHMSAKQDYSPAQYNLGAMYEQGNGVKRDIDEAVKWYRNATILGYSKARKRLSELLKK